MRGPDARIVHHLELPGARLTIRRETYRILPRHDHRPVDHPFVVDDPLDLAHSLYSALLGPLEPLLADKAHLIVVNSGALTSLPLHVLVTQKPSAKPSVRAFFSAYRSAAWLMRRHAVTVLPSVANLKARAQSVVAPQPFFGFGDPLVGPAQAPSGGSRARGGQAPTVSYHRLFREGHVDLA